VIAQLETNKGVKMTKVGVKRFCLVIQDKSK